jgi:hypothetical protein
LRDRVQDWQDQGRQVNAANIEAKNFVLRVEKEAREKVKA